MAGGARVVKIRDRWAVAEVIVHHLLGVERTHEDIAAPHVDGFARIIPRGVDASRDDVPAGALAFRILPPQPASPVSATQNMTSDRNRAVPAHFAEMARSQCDPAGDLFRPRS